MKISMGRLPVAAMLLLAVSVPLGAQQQAPQGPPPALVQVGEARLQRVQNRTGVIGRLLEVRRAVVACELGGRVVAVNVEEGTAVVGGQTVLAQIDDVWARVDLEAAEADLARTQANVAEAEARLENARRERGYLEQLYQQRSARPKEVEDALAIERMAIAAVQSAQAQVLESQANVTRANERLSRTRILAPFDGVVVRKATEVGQWLQQGGEVAEVISHGAIDAVIAVPERLINHLSMGDAVDVSVVALSLELPGRVAAINPAGLASAKTFAVKVRVDDQQGTLKPAMSVTAHVPAGDMIQAIIVPRDAVRRSSQGDTVWARVNDVAHPIAVQVLFGVGNAYAVRPRDAGSPLSDGTQVVTEGAERLFPGQPLIVQRLAANH
jgi:membrane fusion protein, multidrug efflux system